MVERKIYQKIGDFVENYAVRSYRNILYRINLSRELFRRVERLYEIEDEIMILMRKLKEVTSQDWSQYIFSLSNNMDFNIKFAYIEEDSWPNLYMKGISDLTKEEAEESYIPEEIWEERVEIKAGKNEASPIMM
ncbi:hypothetical protein ACPWUF_02500 [Bisgaard Taxon 46]